MNSTTELSNLSYTNKDFNSIYNELLEYAKAISYKWDPTASDESDPGIVLLKLAALIGDKDNYNIDKNILELMPVSVTQPSAARQVFEQCGYSMKHYIAAEGKVNVTVTKPFKDYDSTPENCKYKLPMFTSFTDTDSIVTYTTTEDIVLTYKETAPVSVIEGTPIQYTINNDTKITIANLDSRNRIYFTESDIAENGIFINNIGETNFNDWYRVDNLSAQPSGVPCYKFSLSVDTQTCYIEFPEDVMTLFKEGINITYIKTSGKSGNIAAKKLKMLANKTNIGIDSDNTDYDYVEIEDQLHIINTLPILTGQDPESIDDAYRSYKRVKDTFDTLVSLKDYTDYMISSESASNGYVCDRLNDIQHSYKVLSLQDYGNEVKTCVEKDAGVDKLNAFNLTCYGLQFRPNVNSEQLFNETFTLIIPDEDGRIKTDNIFESVKSLQHDFKTFEENKILLIKNKYPVKTTIIPRYKVSLIEKYQIEENVRIALYDALNSKKLYFGDPISYDLIYDTIINADERIKAVTLNFPTYETYAVYLDESRELQELRIDSNSLAPTDTSLINLWNSFRTEIFAKNVLKGVTPLYEFDETFRYGVNQKINSRIENVVELQTNTNITFTLDVDGTTYKQGVKPEEGEWSQTTLSENENILLTAPSFIEENNFSSYVKIIYNLSNDIQANQKYELSGNDEFIVFLWKASDADNEYTYVKYDNSEDSPAKVISPAFMLPKTQWSIDKYANLTEYFKSSISAGKGKVSPHSTVTIDDTLYKVNDAVSAMSQSKIKDGNSLEVLTGSNIIKTYKVNSVTINQACCWITNDISDDRYILQFDSSNNRTLKAGEYFFYTNTERTLLNILGEGTKLTADKTSLALSCKTFSYEELMTEGIDYIADILATQSGVTITATEMQTILLGPGSSLKFTRTEIEPDETTITLSSSGFVDTSVTFSSLSYSSNGTETEIPLISSSDGNWEVSSILNINCTNKLPQKLQSNQELRYKTKTGDEEYLTSGYSILSSKKINKVGNVIDLTKTGSVVTDPDGLSILTYTDVQDATVDGPDLSYDNKSFTCAFIVPKENSNSNFTLPEIKLEIGTYLIQVTSEALMSSLWLSINATDSSIAELDYIRQSTGTPGSKPLKSAVYKLTVKEASEFSMDFGFKIDSSESVNSAGIVIHPLKMITSDSAESDFRTAVLDKVMQLDLNSEFDYIYDIINPIKDPLNPESFCNMKHFYNLFTICQWQETDTENGTDIEVSLSIK